METIKSFKGFDKNLKCRDFQYEIGGEYEENGKISACNNGFHACERPLDVFAYYPPATSRYCEVEQGGKLDRDGDDSKVASSKIKIGAEIGIPGLVKAQVEYVKEHTTTEHTAGDLGVSTAGDGGVSTAGNRGVSTAGNRGVSTAGYRGVSTAGDGGVSTAGNRGVSTAGHRGVSTAGDLGVSTAGDRGVSTAGDLGVATSRGSVSVGENGVGLVRGNGVKARGGIGSVLVIAVENEHNCELAEWKAFVVDGETVKPDTWYTLKDGELVEVEA